MNSESKDSIFLKACRGEETDRTPVWFMRQAGRFNPKHRELYEKHGVRGITTTPELNAKVTCLPVTDFQVDAAVMYADIILPLEDMGIDFHYGTGDQGPIMETRIRSLEDVEQLRELEPQRGVPYILEALKIAKKELPEGVPLIGFSGGPFTLACYILEEEASRTYPRTKKFMHQQPKAFHELMDRLTASIINYLQAKVQTGADAIQLFDSWMGALSPETYQKHIAQYTNRVFDTLSDEFPSIPLLHFSTNTFGTLEEQFASNADVIGLDWRMSFPQVQDRMGSDHVLMGNLDPSLLLTNDSIIEDETRRILREGSKFKGHIFNLGHRVPNEVDVSSLRNLVSFIHEFSEEN